MTVFHFNNFLWGHRRVILLALVSFICGTVVSPFISEIARLVAQKYFSSKELSYQVLSISKHKREELSALAGANSIGDFNLDLDDSILTDYYLIKVDLRNGGKAIDLPLRFNVSFRGSLTKIIDIKHKILSPVNKSIKIMHSLPRLKWHMPDRTNITWTHNDIHRVAGFHIYRSLCKNVGFGRLNDELVTKIGYGMPFELNKNLLPSYYKIATVGVNGMEILSDDLLKFPDMLAFAASFKDVYWVNPNSQHNQKPDGSHLAPFHSLLEAIKKTGQLGTFVVDQNRENVTSSENVSKEATVFYKENLDFLDGNTGFSLLNGLDEKAKIEFFFLCKLIPKKEIEFILTLEGAPEIRFICHGPGKRFLKEETDSQLGEKKSLTPRVVRTYHGRDAIYLVWEKPESPAYKGVRIFRSERRGGCDFTDIGDELYEGPGIGGGLELEFYRDPLGVSGIMERIGGNQVIESFHPPPKKGIMDPASPRGLKVVGTYTYDISLPYFIDKTVRKNVAYTYTIYAYSSDGQYSYPILVNASVSDWSTSNNCYPKGQPAK